MAQVILPQKLKNTFHFFQAFYYSNLLGNPSRKLKIIGVTGTDGKTTTSNMIYEILNKAGKKVGLISTIGAKICGEDIPLAFHVTTPNPREIQSFLKKMVDADLEYVVLETTSHGLDQHRVGCIKYAAAVYTNITHEHLDYHKTFEKYREAKLKLIDQTIAGGVCVINKDDPSFDIICDYAVKHDLQTIFYSIADDEISDNVARATLVTQTATGYKFSFNSNTINLELPGEYNVSNAMAAMCVCQQMGVSTEVCKAALEQMGQLEGRWMVLQSEPFGVVVDFAHTPNALLQVLSYARKQVTRGKVYVVFGCAGLRDHTKRPLMGEVSAQYADITVLTAEDPRTEKVEEINKQVISGITKIDDKSENRDYFSIPDRKEAIKFAIHSAKPGDLIIVTGKGHERSMNLDGIHEIPWSDVEVCKDILNNKYNA